jgi:DNA-binding MurR/RpiR family transcriptional regulator
MTEFGSAMFQPGTKPNDSLIVTDGSRRQNDILRMEAVSRAGATTTIFLTAQQRS